MLTCITQEILYTYIGLCQLSLAHALLRAKKKCLPHGLVGANPNTRSYKVRRKCSCTVTIILDFLKVFSVFEWLIFECLML